MAAKKRYQPDMTMDVIIDLWPKVIPLLIEMKLLCIGCPISSFHTLDEACREHSVDAERFMPRLLLLMD